MHNGDEYRLIARLQHREEAALRELMDLYGTRLLRLAYMLLKDRRIAEDVTQEVFLAAYQHIGQFRQEAGLLTWLSRITVNACRARLRRRERGALWLPFHLWLVDYRLRQSRPRAIR